MGAVVRELKTLVDSVTGDFVGFEDADGSRSFPPKFIIDPATGSTTGIQGPAGELKTNGFDLVYKDMSVSVPTATTTGMSTITVSKDTYNTVSDIVNGYFKIPSWATGMEMAINVDWSDPGAATSTVRYIGVELEVSPTNWFAFGIPGYPVLNVVGFETHQPIYISAFESVASNTGKQVRTQLYQGSPGTLNPVHIHVGVKFTR